MMTAPPPVRPSLRQLWWLPVIGLVLLALILWRVLAPALNNPELARATAKNVADKYNGFSLSTCSVDRALIAKGAVSREAIPPLVDAPLWQGNAVAGINEHWRRERHMKALVANDQVIGVSINGEARAYPVCILNWHEVADDLLGGEAIAVTYCPLTASAVVAQRELDGHVLELAASGLLYNSNSLLFDKQAGAGRASLYSQLDLRAVSGPAAQAGVVLKQLPAELTLWGDWLARHPETTVLSLETGFTREYDADTYGNYYDRGMLRFPTAPRPSTDGLALMARCLAVQSTAGWRIYPHAYLLERIGAGASWGQDGLVFTVARGTASIIQPELHVADSTGASMISTPGLWFALQTFLPDAVLVRD
jgi:hypothetical protein